VAGWSAWSTYAQIQTAAQATQDSANSQAAMAAKQANSQANITYTQAVGLAQIARRQAEANAQASYQVNYSVVTQSQSVAQAQQTLAFDQAQPASYFASRVVNIQPPFQTLSQQYNQSMQNYSWYDRWLGEISFGVDLLSNGGWSELVTSPQFTNALNATDAFFAGWADGLTLGLSTKLRTEMYGDLATRNHQGAYFNAGNLVGSIQLQLDFCKVETSWQGMGTGVQ
jgi:multidrug efflux pump subunit AcrA (membrane-fusion protein)